MAQIRLIPSTYYLSNTQYLSVSDASNMYANTDSTNYGRVTNSRSSTTSYYIYLRGFNFDDVPSDAVVSSITIKLKGYHSGGNTGTIYGYDGTTQVSAAGSASSLGTSAAVRTFSNTTIDWDTLKGYGSDFGLRINCKRSNKSTTSYIYIYGAEIVVDYTVPVYHTVSITGTDTDPTGSVTVLEGSDLDIHIYKDNKPTVTDNNVDVTSQLVELHEATDTLIPESNTNSNFSLTNISNAYTDADSDTYATLELSGSTTGTIYLDLSDLDIPSGATIQSVTCQATLQFSRNGSTSGFTSSCQMYTGNTAKGSSYSFVSSGSSDVSKTTITLTIGNWTASEIANARFYLTATNSARSTKRYMYIYGVSFNVTYESENTIYVYSLTNITGDHAIVVTDAIPSSILYWKNNGSWVTVLKGYKKVNGVWVEQDITSLFSNAQNYKKGT